MFETLPHLPIKRAREESDPASDSDNMDFQHAENITATQALGDGNESHEYPSFQLSPPLNPEHAALHSDFELITLAAMDRLYHWITADIAKSAADTATSFQKTTDKLHSQIHSLGARVTQLQQQILTYQQPISPPVTAPATAPVKKTLKLKLMKKNLGQDVAAATATTETTPSLPLVTPQTTPTNTQGWETVPSGGTKLKAPTPKLIPTKYPQAEREVTCHFQNVNADDMDGIRPDKT